ncbi:hypothetical protein OU798_03105 [Prolixibacteraceae bacterium Z1-6]|uniref:Uncharacterized protein n=1 Tax=Draconibacterium aestuarii TaxID=2998507 RepID=A0A9X3J5D4_9BACT|nr:hypothetical protein [Prolixibacteraceae bacterium Z1-6]
MNWKKYKFILSLTVLLLALFFIFIKPELLTQSVFSGTEIPLGSLVSWLGVFGYASFFYFLFPLKNKSVFLKSGARVLFFNRLLASFWGVISALLAGNWAFVFENQQLFKVWITCTAFILLLPLIVYLILGAKKLFHKL